MRVHSSFCRNWIPGILSFLFLFMNFISAAPKTGDTMWIDVTYFDFHSDGTNPEFENKNHYAGVKTGMVQKFLDADGLPVVTTNQDSINLNAYIKYWYRAFKAGDYTIPTYGGSPNYSYTGTKTVLYDTAFKNVVIKDSLPFIYDATTGKYSYNNDSFFPLDTVSFSANEKKVADDGKLHNFSFTMKLHYIFKKSAKENSQVFNFTGDDDVWVFVNNQLTTVDLGGIHKAESGSFSLSNTLTPNVEYPLDVFYAERNTTASHIHIETNLFQPTVVVGIKSNDTTVNAGDTLKIPGVVSEDNIPNNTLSKKIVWTDFVSKWNSPSSYWANIDKVKKIGDTLCFAPLKAYDTVSIVASYKDSISGETKRDTIQIVVKPGPAHHISIESDTIPDLRNDDTLSSVLITDSMTNGTKVYAIVRDKNGNYVRLSNAITTVWSAIDPSVLTAVGEPNKKYQGDLSRPIGGVGGVTKAIANEPSLIPDTVPVTVATYYIKELRIINRATKKVETTINMTTNDSALYDVFGWKSSSPDSSVDSAWISLGVKWVLNPPLKSSNPTSTGDANSWLYSPSNPGSGTLVLTNTADSRTKVLTVPVTITIGTALSVNIKLLTPKDSCIAGNPIKFQVEIRNQDGLVPGTYCFGNNNPESGQVIYQDTLKSPLTDRRPSPQVTVDGQTTNLNTGLENSTKNNECFSNGIDTIQTVLNFSPYNPDSMHVIKVDLGIGANGERKAQSEPFTLWPAKLDSLVITNAEYQEITAPVPFGPGDAPKEFHSLGYDRYGNYLGPQNSDWSTSGQIKDTSKTDVPNFRFGPGTVLDDQTGKIRSQRVVDGKTVSDEITVIVYGKLPALSYAITRDLNSNGYLDRIDLIFSKKVTLTPDMLSKIDLSFNGKSFVKTKIEVLDNDSSKYGVYFNEDQTAEPQTSWRPFVSINGIASVENVNRKIALDGAAPVVWKAVKAFGDPAQDLTKSTLTITLSEKVVNANKFSFVPGNKPDSLFNIWVKQPSGGFIYQPLLENISGFQQIIDDSIFIITMTNGHDITGYDSVNIRDINKMLSDKDGNFPNSDNVKKKVEVLDGPDMLTIGPNPSSPSFRHTGPGVLILQDDDQAVDFAKQGEGIMLNVRFPGPKEGETIKGILKVYDLAGNLVQYASEDNILRNQKDQKSFYEINMYWNMSTSKGMKAAPGLYKTVMYLTWSNHSHANFRSVKIVGVKK